MKLSAPQSPALFHLIAQRLRKDLQEGTASSSQAKLARLYGISVPTLRKAIRVLEVEMGPMVFRGKTFLQKKTFSSEIRTTSLTRCQDWIRTQLNSSSFRNGSPLPKQTWLASSTRMSTKTVAAAIRMLEKEALVHKCGKNWIAGPEIPSKSGTHRKNRPTIIFAIPSMSTMLKLFNNQPWNGFYQSFFHEIDAWNVAVEVAVVLDQKSDHRMPFLYDCDEIVERISALGTRFSGLVVVDTSDSHDMCSRLVRTLVKVDHRIVIVDADCNPRWKSFRSHRIAFIRCPESQACGRVLDELIAAGHRKVAYIPHRIKGIDDHWQEVRWQELSRQVKGREGHIKLVQFPFASVFARNIPMPQIAELFKERWNSSPVRRTFKDAIASAGMFFAANYPFHKVETDLTPYEVAARMFRYLSIDATRRERLSVEQAWIMKWFPIFTYAVERMKVTAVIAPDDTIAVWYYSLLTRLGYSVPERISIVSFGNLPDSRLFPIDTVDFGMEHLGITAFRFILNSARVRFVNGNTIEPAAWYISRGAVGAA